MKKLNFLTIVRVSCFLVLLGRGWQHLFWDIPLRSILWDQELLEPIVKNLFNTDWKSYVSSSAVDNSINYVTKIIGTFYLGVSLVSLKIDSNNKRLGKLLLISSLLLFSLAILLFISKNFYIGMLIEHAIQFSAPTLFYICLFHFEKIEKYIIYFKIAISLTFIGHGLFAIGFHPVPGSFIDMIISVLGLSEPQARLMLVMAGSVDFMAGIFIFIPIFEKYALSFNIFWGILTALARVVSNINFDLAAISLNQWFMETIFRIPHGLIPLGVLVYLLSLSSSQKMNNVNNN